MRFALAVGGGVAAALSIGACGGPTTALREDNRALERRFDSLQAKYLRARRTVRDLQNRIILLEEELDEQPSLNQPVLPVEVIGPEGGTATGAVGTTDDGYGYDDGVAAAAPVPGADIVVEGSPAFEGDVEVIYEGEAARGSGSPSVSLDGKLVRPRPRPQVPRANSAPPPLPQAPRLTVVDEVPPVPTTGGDEAAARARAAGPAARSRVAPSPVVQARPAKPPPARRRRPTTADPRSLYKRHYDALRAGEHDVAIAGFRAFIAAHPRHDYADNAQYWLGEAYYDQREYKRALVEFERVAERFPAGNKVPDAMLKVAFCHQKLGDLGQARAVLTRIVREHPKTNPAALAEDRLAALSE